MSLFKKAVSLPSKTPGAKKPTKQEIAMKGIERLAELHAMMTNLKGVYASIEGEMKAAGFGEFLAMETKARPESFKGIDGHASCSVEMRKRATTSALNEDEVELLAAYGLKPGINVITPELFGINPKYAGDEALMGKVSKAIEKFVPDDFIVHQEKVETKVVNDEMLAAAFALEHGSSEREIALKTVTVMALKPRLNEDYALENLNANVTSYLASLEGTDEQTAEAVEIIQKAEAPAAEAPKKVVRKTKAVA